eukprot:TRINITY_DN1147_c0_g2_i1.p1 TRINITY_DN1147_c0_g2~~TRINITY_DN1147_c0_g2_i1.p1  ORF type:complete len:1050 (-),score=151.90 TRINITY_DN1147_c0_g2_i1:249-3398(-)
MSFLQTPIRQTIGGQVWCQQPRQFQLQQRILKLLQLKMLTQQLDVLKSALGQIKMPLTFETRLQLSSPLVQICGCLEWLSYVVSQQKQDVAYKDLLPVHTQYVQYVEILGEKFVAELRTKSIELITELLQKLDDKEDKMLELVLTCAKCVLGLQNSSSGFKLEGIEEYFKQVSGQEGKVSGYQYGDPWAKRFSEAELRSQVQSLQQWRCSMVGPRSVKIELNDVEMKLLAEMVRQCMNPYQYVRSYSQHAVTRIFKSYPELFVAFLPHILEISCGLQKSLPPSLQPYNEWPSTLSSALKDRLQQLQSNSSSEFLPKLDSEGLFQGALILLTKFGTQWQKQLAEEPRILRDLCYSLLIMQAHQDQKVERLVDKLLTNVLNVQWHVDNKEVLRSLVSDLAGVEFGGQGVQVTASFMLIKLVKQILPDAELVAKVLQKMVGLLSSEHTVVAQSGVLGCALTLREWQDEQGMKKEAKAVVELVVQTEGFMEKFLDMIAALYAQAESGVRRRQAPIKVIETLRHKYLGSHKLDVLTSTDGSCIDLVVNVAAYIHEALIQSPLLKSWIDGILTTAVKNADPLTSNGNVETKHKAWAARDVLIGFLASKTPKYVSEIMEVIEKGREQAGVEDSYVWSSSYTLAIFYYYKYRCRDVNGQSRVPCPIKSDVESRLIQALDRNVTESGVDVKPLDGLISYFNFWLMEDQNQVMEFISTTLDVLEKRGWLVHPVRTVRLQVALLLTLFSSFFCVQKQQQVTRQSQTVSQNVKRVMDQIVAKFIALSSQVAQEQEIDRQTAQLDGGMGIAIFSTVCSNSFLTIPSLVLKLQAGVFHMVNIKDSNELQTLREDATVAAAKTKYLLFNTPEVNHIITQFCDTNEFVQTQWQERAVRLQFLQVFWFRHDLVLSNSQEKQIQTLAQVALKDDKLEIRKVACSLLTGMVKTLSADDFLSMVQDLLSKTKKGNKKLSSDDKHGVVLSMKAVLDSQPYDIEDWMPKILLALARVGSKWGAPAGPAASDAVVEFRRTKDQQQIAQLKDMMDMDEWDEVQGTGVQTTYFA